jgi:hypothetical protein
MNDGLGQPPSVTCVVRVVDVEEAPVELRRCCAAAGRGADLLAATVSAVEDPDTKGSHGIEATTSDRLQPVFRLVADEARGRK